MVDVKGANMEKITEDDLNKVTGGAYAEVVDGSALFDDSDGPIIYIITPSDDARPYL